MLRLKIAYQLHFSPKRCILQPLSDRVSRLVAYIGSIVSTAGITYSTTGSEQNNKYAAVLILLFIFCIIYEVKLFFAKDPSLVKTESEYQQRMFDFIKDSEDETVIVTRRLSWVKSDSQMESILLEKSRNRSLTVFLKEENMVGRKLANSGASVYIYDSTRYAPAKGFCIVGFDTDQPRTAVGWQIMPNANQVGPISRRLYIYTSDKDPLTSIAWPLVEFLRSHSRKLI
jgi:hypothetical protein